MSTRKQNPSDVAKNSKDRFYFQLSDLDAERRNLREVMEGEAKGATTGSKSLSDYQKWCLSKTRGRISDVAIARRYKEHKYVITEYEDGRPWAICTCGFAYQARVDIHLTRKEFLQVPGHLDFPDR